MSNFLLIGICIIVGMLFTRSKTLPADAHKGINAWIIYVALPAVSFKYLPHITWSYELTLPILSPVIVWCGSWLLMHWYGTANKLSKKTIGGLKLTAGLSNTTFVAFPLILAYYSEKELSIGIIYDQANFMMLSVAGVIVAVNSSKKEKLTPLLIINRLLKFPPFIGCIAALTIPHFINIEPLDPLFTKLAATVGPLALFSIGLQIKFAGWRRHIKTISFALLYKLILAPAVIFVIAAVAGFKGTIAQISVFEAAMPTLLTAGIVADNYELDPDLVNLIIGIGILLSFITTGFWWYFLQWFNVG